MSNNVSMSGFSDGVASVIGYARMEVREEVKNTFRSLSHKLQTELPTACNAVKGIENIVFESILDSLIPMDDDDSHLNQDVSTDGYSSMIDGVDSHVFDTVSEGILHSTDSNISS